MSLPIKNVDKNFCSQNFDFVSGKYNPRGGENCEFFFRNFENIFPKTSFKYL